MASSKLRTAFGIFKDQASIGLAKVTGNATISDLEVAILKATSHEEFPSDRRHIRDILDFIAYSRSFISCCIASIATRLRKTHSWAVAIKALMLLQRLRSNGDPTYEQEVFLGVRRGKRLFNLSDFRDESGRPDASHYTAFVRSYAMYLDAHLEFRMQGQRKNFGMAPKDMRNEAILAKVEHLLLLVERILACMPTGATKDSCLARAALFPIVVESFQIYRDMKKMLDELTGRFQEFDTPDMVRAHRIFSRAMKAFRNLDCFYNWCRAVEIVKNSGYPNVEKITQQELDTMDGFINQKSDSARKTLVQVLN